MSAAVENIASLPHPVSIGGVARPCGVSAPGSVRAVELLLNPSPALPCIRRGGREARYFACWRWKTGLPST